VSSSGASSPSSRITLTDAPAISIEGGAGQPGDDFTLGFPVAAMGKPGALVCIPCSALPALRDCGLDKGTVGRFTARSWPANRRTSGSVEERRR